ncbi:MAG TPA: TIGR02147 family protein, partial [Chitinispirillaceae bacterium]|nr:TIGR02147 family protein [Chitinispirillaceae bacterium]
KDALYRFSKKDRCFSALTLSVSQQGFDTIRQKIDSMRAELIDLVKHDTNIDRVVQVNFQIFPLTETDKTSENVK